MALTCGTVSSGYDLSCLNNGGSSTIWLATYDDATVWTTDVTNGITVIADSPTFWKFEQPTDIIAVGGNNIFSKDNRTYGFDNTLTFKLFDATTVVFEQLLTLQKSNLVAVVKTRGGRYIAFGVDGPGFVETVEGGVEATRDGMNGYTITLKWDDVRPPFEMAEAVFLSDIVIGS